MNKGMDFKFIATYRFILAVDFFYIFKVISINMRVRGKTKP